MNCKSGQQQGLRKQWIIYLKAILNDSLLLNLNSQMLSQFMS